MIVVRQASEPPQYEVSASNYTAYRNTNPCEALGRKLSDWAEDVAWAWDRDIVLGGKT